MITGVYHETVRYGPDVSLVSAHRHLLQPIRHEGTEKLPENPSFTHRVVARLGSHSNVSLSEHSRGIKVLDDALEIFYEGFYFVYSNVNFKANSSRFSSEFIYQTWFQYVSRNCARIPMMSGVLLRTVHTVCHNCTLNQETAFTGGVFYLLQGDTIQVVFSGQGIAQFNTVESYIGLVMISR
ncbi:uncharacterized protein LOC131954289 [Physella acuta]|uniref:uncharacterized protein LOC131954289 n=1 Tax=Physella acuta TaxID=109671 RepID=UPI0027DB78CA|nr:uncharacterized protein LOC131954289 [Physella acuta]